MSLELGHIGRRQISSLAMEARSHLGKRWGSCKASARAQLLGWDCRIKDFMLLTTLSLQCLSCYAMFRDHLITSIHSCPENRWRVHYVPDKGKSYEYLIFELTPHNFHSSRQNRDLPLLNHAATLSFKLPAHLRPFTVLTKSYELSSDIQLHQGLAASKREHDWLYDTTSAAWSS